MAAYTDQQLVSDNEAKSLSNTNSHLIDVIQEQDLVSGKKVPIEYIIKFNLGLQTG